MTDGVDFHPLATPPTFEIDDQFRSHIPSLREDEFRQLEANIIRDGCIQPLVVWNGLLLDGHNRFAICQKHGINYRVETASLLDREAAIEWIENNQLGRRNLTADQFSYFVGRKYERTKRQGERSDLTCGQNDHKLKASQEIAERHGIGEKTVRRAAEFARDVDHIARQIGESARTEILDGRIPATRAELQEVAESLPAAKEAGLTFASPKEALAWVKQIRADQAIERRDVRIANIAEISKGNVELNVAVRYPVIYADPPWRYENPPMGASSRSIENHYPTMSLEEICAMPVADLATDDAILYLWATAPKLEECLKVIAAWGFVYRTNFVWIKDKIGMGYHARSQHEILLIAKRGNIPPPAVADRVSSVVSAARGAHSEKPEEFYGLIESFYPTLPKIELFCRSPRDGWAVWGNQAVAA